MNRLTRLAITFAAGAALIGVAMAAASYTAGSPPAPLVKDLAFYRVFFTVAVTILLLVPTFPLFTLQRGVQPSSAWRALWTLAFVTFVAHVYWAITGMMGGHLSMVFRQPDLVSSPWLDIVITAWWGLDVLLAWTVERTPKWVHAQRSALNFVLFAAFVVAGIPQGQGLVRALTIMMVISTVTGVVARVVLREPVPGSFVDRVYVALFQALNLLVPWYRLPSWLAIANLGALRVVLRTKNLHNTSTIPVTRREGLAPLPDFQARDLLERAPSGCYDDLEKPTMGRSSASEKTPGEDMEFTLSDPGARFGRNVPLEHAYPDQGNLLHPNPREISTRLLARRAFIPAPTLNLLAAAWIQYQTHDWFNHGEPETEDPIKVPLPRGDRWHECPMRIRRTRRDPTRDYARETREQGEAKPPPTYANVGTHWWDASQLYGTDPETVRALRTDPTTHRLLDDGKLYLVDNHLAVSTATGGAVTGFTENWWIGLTLMHTLFALEHNAICDRLRSAYREWDGDRVFAVARMINVALMAKIHTVEWTPAILMHPVIKPVLDANWWGLQTARVRRLLGRLSENELFGGILGSGVDHHGADYCFTEEFVSVYRMHPLLPDALDVVSAATGDPIKSYVFPEGLVGAEKIIEALARDGASLVDLLYSFGVAHPGAITLHNYPRFLQRLTRKDEILDLGSIEILRDRERGVPRYNELRRLLHLSPIRSFDDLKNAQHPGLPEELREIYGKTGGKDNVELLDLMVGLFSETPPPGFGFSDTAFRVFIVMASRRLKSDRFFAGEFNADVYTQAGLDWIDDSTMKTVLLRHFPALGPALRDVENAFAPWTRIALEDER